MFDSEAAIRHAFGPNFDTSSTDHPVADRMLASREVRLSPHKAWILPEHPTWREDPFDDTNWTFQYHSLRWLDPLRRRAATGDLSGMHFWQDVIESWIVANPVGTEYRWAWTDMSDAFRAMTLCFGLPYLLRDSALIIDSLQQHLAWLREEVNLGRGNHALHQHTGLFVTASVLKDEESMALASERLSNYIEREFGQDGVNIEGAVGYHRLNWIWTRNAVAHIKAEAFPLTPAADRLNQTPQYLAHATRPDGYLEDIGDTGPVRIPKDSPSPELKYVATAGSDGVPPSTLSFKSEHGLFFIRSGWGETEVPFEKETYFSGSFGAQNKIHGHVDGGSITMMSNGVRWLIDTGKYSYQSNPIRDFVISRRGHNVCDVVNHRYNSRGTVELSTWNTDGELYLAEFKDSNYEGVTIFRRAVINPHQSYVAFFDYVMAKGEVKARSYFHLGPGISIKAKTKTGYQLQHTSGEQGRVLFGGSVPDLMAVRGQEDPVQGWLATAWKKATPVNTVIASRSGRRFRISSAVLGHERISKHLGFRLLANEAELEFEISGRTEDQRVRITSDGPVIIARRANDTDAWDIITTASRYADPSLRKEDNSRSRAFVGSLRNDLVEGTISPSQAFSETEDFMRSRIEAGLSHSTPEIDALRIDIKGDPSRRAGNRISLYRSAYTDSSYQQLKAQDKVSSLINLPSWQRIDRAPLETALFTINHGADLIPILYEPGSRKSTLIVSFHGALDRAKYSLPAFQRRQSLLQLGFPSLLVADHSLDRDPNMTLSWYLSGWENGYYRGLATFVKNFANELKTDQLLLVGSSGGGFAALKLAEVIPTADVLAINPQINLTRYYERFVDRAKAVLDLPQTEQNLYVTTPQSLRVEARTGKITFVRNRGDRHHWKEHIEPFVNAFPAARSELLEVVEVDWGAGHKSPNADQFLEIVKSSIED